MPLALSATNVADRYNMLRNQASIARDQLLQVQRDSATGNVTGFLLLTALGSAITTLQNAQMIAADVASADAMISYVRMMAGNPELDVHGELAASMAALSAVVSAILQEYPKTEDGYLRDRRFGADGIPEWDSVLSASLTATNAAISVWLAMVT